MLPAMGRTEVPAAVIQEVVLHNLSDGDFVHTDLQALRCACGGAALAEAPRTFQSSDGPSCANCGAITVLQGACWLCRTCGNTTGCG